LTSKPDLQTKRLQIRATDDVSISLIVQAFAEDNWTDIVDIDVGYVLLSVEPPSFVNIVSDWAWWQQLAAWTGAVFATGYVAKAGSDLWDKQPKLLEQASGGLCSLARRLVALRENLKSRTAINVGAKSKNGIDNVLLHLDVADADAIAFKIAALCYHAKSLESFSQSDDFDAVFNGHIFVNDDGSILLRWCDRVSNEMREKTFSI